MLTEAIEFDCPWCGERNFFEADPGEAGQWLTQDCAVCCQPIEIRAPDDLSGALRIERG